MSHLMKEEVCFRNLMCCLEYFYGKWESFFVNAPEITHIQSLLKMYVTINPLSPELNPICYLLALLAHHFLHVSRIRVKSLTLR